MTTYINNNDNFLIKPNNTISFSMEHPKIVGNNVLVAKGNSISFDNENKSDQKCLKERAQIINIHDYNDNNELNKFKLNNNVDTLFIENFHGTSKNKYVIVIGDKSLKGTKSLSSKDLSEIILNEKFNGINKVFIFGCYLRDFLSSLKKDLIKSGKLNRKIQIAVPRYVSKSQRREEGLLLKDYSAYDSEVNVKFSELKDRINKVSSKNKEKGKIEKSNKVSSKNKEKGKIEKSDLKKIVICFQSYLECYKIENRRKIEKNSDYGKKEINYAEKNIIFFNEKIKNKEYNAEDTINKIEELKIDLKAKSKKWVVEINDIKNPRWRKAFAAKTIGSSD